jgi:membrane protease YdiL (CAAX protease family)
VADAVASCRLGACFNAEVLMRLQWLVLGLVLALMASDYFVVWRAFVRQSQRDAAKARHALWLRGALLMWAASASVLWLWISTGVPLSSVGLDLPDGWRLWGPLAFVAAFVALQASSAVKLARLAAPNEKYRARLGGAAPICPRTAAELPAFFAVSLTAGFCEELVFRGFLIWVLQPLVGLWIAVALAALLFGLGHAYQGLAGVIRTALLGLVFTAVVLLTRSLWPAIVLHAAVDAMGGVIAWLILRDPAPSPLPPPSAAVEAARP